MISTVSLSDPTIDQLRDLYRSNPVAMTLLDCLGRRRRDTAELKIEHAIQILANESVTASRGQLFRVLKTLEELGFGQVILGRGSCKTRIAWTYSPKGIGRAAVGNQEDIPELLKVPEGCESGGDATNQHIGIPSVKATANEEVEFIPHELQLRPDLSIQLELPLDMTPGESQRLALFVQALPFEDLQTAC